MLSQDIKPITFDLQVIYLNQNCLSQDLLSLIINISFFAILNVDCLNFEYLFLVIQFDNLISVNRKQFEFQKRFFLILSSENRKKRIFLVANTYSLIY